MAKQRRRKASLGTRLMMQHCGCEEPESYDVMCTCCTRMFDPEVLNELCAMPFPRLAPDERA